MAVRLEFLFTKRNIDQKWAPELAAPSPWFVPAPKSAAFEKSLMAVQDGLGASEMSGENQTSEPCWKGNSIPMLPLLPWWVCSV